MMGMPIRAAADGAVVSSKPLILQKRAMLIRLLRRSFMRGQYQATAA